MIYVGRICLHVSLTLTPLGSQCCRIEEAHDVALLKISGGCLGGVIEGECIKTAREFLYQEIRTANER